ncbi:MAG: glycosyltransferase family 2 protein [Bacteroidales bacterium]|nr:glycosyltransferase family 2 protein [Bacteroidales bacterium]
MDDIVLSFIVVAHNHEKCITRCLDSILAQKIHVPYEIIVGDDNSSDRTWTIMEEYRAKYPDTIVIYHVNSNDCNPITLSDRASYNRGHAYGLLRGKYYAEVDGDDFLLPNDTYQKQVDLLESHPDCWLCMQNILILPDGADLSKAQTYRPKDRFENGQIISARNYILHPDWFAQHQSFVYRRNMTISPIENLGLEYEDTTATLFHLQFGSIICLNQSGYVWVNYKNGINGSLLGDDRLVALALLEIEHMQLFPKFADLILQAALPELIHLLKVTTERKLDISCRFRMKLSRYKGFIFRYFEKEKHGVIEEFRLRMVRYLLLMMKKFNLTSISWLKLAKRIML